MIKIKTTDRNPPKPGKYFVYGRFIPYESKLTEGAVYFDGDKWHVSKFNQVVEWIDVAGTEDTLKRLMDWKLEALEVMPDMQVIGNLIEVPLGQSVHDKIIPAIKDFKRQIELLENRHMQ